MKKITTITLLFLSFSVFSQNLSKKDIWNKNVTISEYPSGAIGFHYQNPDYQQIVDIVSFSTTNKDSALLLMDEALKILEMEKPPKDQRIEHEVDGVKLTRYAFAPKIVYISDGEDRALMTRKKTLMKYKEALEAYEYSSDKNK